MSHDAVNAYAADVNAGKDALLVCDTTEMCDALNRRIHDAKVAADTPTVTAARGQRIAVGDLIISRRNDSTMRIYQAEHNVAAADPVRNGNRWQVAAVDADRNRIAARRLSDGARAVFDGDYVRAHITSGYAVTVHAAQGVTADTSQAVLGEKATRARVAASPTAPTCTSAWPRRPNTAMPAPTGCTCCAAAEAAPPPSSSGKSSPPMRAHRPHTNSPPKSVESVCQCAWQPCS
jgi:hypothetical protein